LKKSQAQAPSRIFNSMSSNVFTALAAGFPAPGAPFAIDAAGRSCSYGELLQHTARCANALQSLGVQPGDRVAAQVDKSIDAIVLYLATLRAGAAFLPLNSAYTAAEMEYFIGDAQPRLLVCSPDKQASLAPLATAGGARLLTLGSDGVQGTLLPLVAAASAQFTDVARDVGDLAAILYTSGTTGRSKGAMVTHGNLLSNALALRTTWHCQSRDVLLHALPIFHIHGLFVALNVTLAAGSSLRLLPRFDAELVFRHLPECNLFMGVPTFYVRLLQDARLSRASTGHMRLFVSGSAPLLADTHREWRERTGHAILERYGMTETGMNSSNPYEGERIPGTVGLPLPGTDIRVTAPDSGQPLPAGETGMLEVRGPNVFAGYWRQPEKTRSEFRDDWFITGDLGLIDERGYVHIVGRSRDLIISGGFNVYPKEVESELDSLDGIAESAVIGLPHRDFGEAVTAVVVARGAALSESALLQQLKTRLAGYKCPKRVLFVADLPRNTMGKVQKNVLRDTYAQLYASGEKASS
jgi:malonyl-CoA/methylmalonyl-CoA synthetase